MPLFEVAGWDRRSAQRVVWYLDAISESVASAYATDAGVNDAQARPAQGAPPGAGIIRVEDAVLSGRPDPRARTRLHVGQILLGALAGVLGTLLVLFLISAMQNS